MVNDVYAATAWTSGPLDQSPADRNQPNWERVDFDNVRTEFGSGYHNPVEAHYDTPSPLLLLCASTCLNRLPFAN